MRAPARLLLGGVMASGLGVAWAQPAPLLQVECEAEYAVYQWRKVFQPDPDQPYTTPGEEVGQRFRLKVLASSRQTPGDTLHVLVSYWDGQQYRVIQQSTFGPEQVRAAQGGGHLTGEQRIYSPDLGRQLRYQCRLLGPASPP